MIRDLCFAVRSAPRDVQGWRRLVTKAGRPLASRSNSSRLFERDVRQAARHAKRAAELGRPGVWPRDRRYALSITTSFGPQETHLADVGRAVCNGLDFVLWAHAGQVDELAVVDDGGAHPRTEVRVFVLGEAE